MYQRLVKILGGYILVVVGLGIMHQWQSGGWGKLSLSPSPPTKFRVGFLPVT